MIVALGVAGAASSSVTEASIFGPFQLCCGASDEQAATNRARPIPVQSIRRFTGFIIVQTQPFAFATAVPIVTGMVRLDIISIGTLSRNRLWNEASAVRTAHATTSLIRTRKATILVDPGLPGVVLGARLHERTGLKPEQIDTIFLTNFRPSHRAGLAAFPKARVFLHEPEKEFAREQLTRLISQAPPQDIDRAAMEKDLALLDSMQNPPDKIAEGIDLFPLPGYTPGTCGLLVSAIATTTLIAGDAVATMDHFLAGQVLPDAYDIKTAQESLQEVYEIADQIVPGHDNIFLNPRIHGM